MPTVPAPSPVPVASGWSLGIRGRDSWREVPLRPGALTIGGRGSDVLLPGAHAGEQARLDLRDEAARLSIASGAAPASIHGVAVRAATLRDGDSFRLGDVELSVHRRRAAEPTPAAQESAEQAAGTAAALPAPLLALLDRICHWALRGSAEMRGSMLAQLAVALDAEAACLLDLPAAATDTPRLVAVWGDPRLDAELVAALRAAGRAAGEDGAVRIARHAGTTASLLRAPGGTTLGLLLRGEAERDREADAHADAALPVATRLFAHELLRERASAPPAAASPVARGLVFHEGIVVGRAPAMTRLYARLASVVEAALPVLVLGETGAGKEHVARLLHDSSSRAARPFVTINCAAIPAELLESELFGIARGVATGVEERAGKFQQADGGTLFLDEIGELPFALQAKLLRVLEEKTVEAVGGRATRIDLRIVAATNLDLAAVAADGRFRLDLYHRLAGFVVEVPPLRERAQDIPLLFGQFLAEASGGSVPLSPAVVTALVRYRWPGNVRELRHEAARVSALRTSGEAVEMRHLSPPIAGSAVEESARGPLPGSLDEELERVERALIASTLAALRGNQSQTAMQLGISRERLRRRLRELGLAVGS